MADYLVIIEVISAIISIIFLVRTWVMFNNIMDIRDFLLKDYDVPRGYFKKIVLKKMAVNKDDKLKVNQVVTRKDQQDYEQYKIVATGPEVSCIINIGTGKEYVVENELLVPYKK